MSQSTEDLKTTIENIESKASDYETATNFEAKKKEYLNGLSSIEKSLQRLEARIERIEFLVAVFTDVLNLDEEKQIPPEVETARRKAESVINHDAQYYYELVDDQESSQYEQRVQQARAKAQDAIDALEAELREIEREWNERVSAARNVQKLFGDSLDMSKTFNEIESFVDRRMWDDSESVTSLRSEWKGLKKNWEKSGADWDTFQKENGLSDRTMEILKDLAKGNDVKLGKLDERVAEEMLSVDELHSVVKITI